MRGRFLQGPSGIGHRGNSRGRSLERTEYGVKAIMQFTVQGSQLRPTVPQQYLSSLLYGEQADYGPASTSTICK